MMPDDALKLDRQLCFPLYAAARLIMRLYLPLLEPLGITYTQYITLLVLWEKDDIPVHRGEAVSGYRNTQSCSEETGKTGPDQPPARSG